MDASNYASNSIDIDLVKASPSKVAVLLNAGTQQQFKDGARIKFLTEIDGKQKDFYPSKTSVKNMINAWGSETTMWVGKAVFLAIVPQNGTDRIVAQPYTPPQRILNQETKNESTQ